MSPKGYCHLHSHNVQLQVVLTAPKHHPFNLVPVSLPSWMNLMTVVLSANFQIVGFYKYLFHTNISEMICFGQFSVFSGAGL